MTPLQLAHSIGALQAQEDFNKQAGVTSIGRGIFEQLAKNPAAAAKGVNWAALQGAGTGALHGAGIGAGVGGLTGAISSDSGERLQGGLQGALGGAALGAIGGGLGGAYRGLQAGGKGLGVGALDGRAVPRPSQIQRGIHEGYSPEGMTALKRQLAGRAGLYGGAVGGLAGGLAGRQEAPESWYSPLTRGASSAMQSLGIGG